MRKKVRKKANGAQTPDVIQQMQIRSEPIGG